MRKTIILSTFVLAGLAYTSEAKAAGAGWGLHSGDTLRGGDNMVYGEFGWPAVTLGFQHGMSDKVDLGFRFDLNYGYEYTTWTVIGMGMRVPIRISVAKNNKISALIHIDPGLKFDSFGRGAYTGGLLFGMQMPIGFELGIHIVPEATLQFGFDMPLYFNFTNGFYAAIPPQFGFGFEYHVDDHIGVGINTRFGPTVLAGGNRYYAWNGVDFGFVVQAGFAYRF